MNPVYGAVGLLWSGNWHLCEEAMETVLGGGTLQTSMVPIGSNSLIDSSSDYAKFATDYYQKENSFIPKSDLGNIADIRPLDKPYIATPGENCGSLPPTINPSNSLQPRNDQQLESERRAALLRNECKRRKESCEDGLTKIRAQYGSWDNYYRSMSMRSGGRSGGKQYHTVLLSDRGRPSKVNYHKQHKYVMANSAEINTIMQSKDSTQRNIEVNEKVNAYGLIRDCHAASDINHEKINTVLHRRYLADREIHGSTDTYVMLQRKDCARDQRAHAEISNEKKISAIRIAALEMNRDNINTMNRDNQENLEKINSALLQRRDHNLADTLQRRDDQYVNIPHEAEIVTRKSKSTELDLRLGSIYSRGVAVQPPEGVDLNSHSYIERSATTFESSISSSPPNTESGF